MLNQEEKKRKEIGTYAVNMFDLSYGILFKFLTHPFILQPQFLQFLEIWFEKSGSRNLVREIWFEKSGSAKSDFFSGSR